MLPAVVPFARHPRARPSSGLSVEANAKSWGAVTHFPLGGQRGLNLARFDRFTIELEQLNPKYKLGEDGRELIRFGEIEGICVSISGWKDEISRVIGRGRAYDISFGDVAAYSFGDLIIPSMLQKRHLHQYLIAARLVAVFFAFGVYRLYWAAGRHAEKAAALGFPREVSLSELSELGPRAQVIADRSQQENRALVSGLFSFAATRANVAMYCALARELVAAPALTLDDWLRPGHPISLSVGPRLKAFILYNVPVSCRGELSSGFCPCEGLLTL